MYTQSSLLSLQLWWVFDPQGTQAKELSKGGLPGPTIPQGWPFSSDSEAFGFGRCCFPSRNSEDVGLTDALELAQMLARWSRWVWVSVGAENREGARVHDGCLG